MIFSMIFIIIAPVNNLLSIQILYKNNLCIGLYVCHHNIGFKRVKTSPNYDKLEVLCTEIEDKHPALTEW